MKVSILPVLMQIMEIKFTEELLQKSALKVLCHGISSYILQSFQLIWKKQHQYPVILENDYHKIYSRFYV